uniref:Glycine cleavage system P-protein N-terminal domain-containing protein n=1 Tax=Meloidogyne enterolobii TaxID=390850 RepID=A0A6V7XLP3_MELEN|nr:unnamed protein product [Meloidogyne enterolobii]
MALVLEKQQMLRYLGFKDLDELTNTNVPESIRLRQKLGKEIPEEGVDESKMLNELKEIASLNNPYKTFIGKLKLIKSIKIIEFLIYGQFLSVLDFPFGRR